MPGKELAPLPDVMHQLPAPADFGKLLRERLEGEIVRVRQERGDVTAPADVNQLVRGLQGAREVFGDYMRAFKGADKIAADEIENELIDAVGEQDGVPMSGLTVPDLDGTDIAISKATANEYSFDLDTLRAAAARDVLRANNGMLTVANISVKAALADEGAPEHEAALTELENELGNLLMAGMERLLELGSFTPQTTKVDRFVKDLASVGDDQLAAIASRAKTKKSIYKGIKVERRERK